jgi:chemotaxis protein CheX
MAAASSTEEQILQYQEHMDRATDEVFSTMMGVNCLPADPAAAAANQEMMTAIIGLAGALSGSLTLLCSSRGAMHVTERMMGFAPEAVDATVRDALGEVCNMVAGAWKGFDTDLASACLLSTPTVVEGTSYELFSQRASIRIERNYRFDEYTIRLTLFCEK